MKTRLTYPVRESTSCLLIKVVQKLNLIDLKGSASFNQHKKQVGRYLARELIGNHRNLVNTMGMYTSDLHPEEG